MNTKIYSSNRRGFLKGLALGAGGIAIGSCLIHPKEAIGQSIQENLEKVPMEARWSITAGGHVRFQMNLLKTILDKEGREKFLDYTKKNSPALGAFGKRIPDRFGFIGTDAKSVAAIIPAAITIFFGPTQRYEIEEATVEKARVRCLECAYWNAMQAQKITDDLCSIHSQYYWEGFAKAINPKLTSTLVKARPLGDSVCEWVIELKA